MKFSQYPIQSKIFTLSERCPIYHSFPMYLHFSVVGIKFFNIVHNCKRIISIAAINVQKRLFNNYVLHLNFLLTHQLLQSHQLSFETDLRDKKNMNRDVKNNNTIWSNSLCIGSVCSRDIGTGWSSIDLCSSSMSIHSPNRFEFEIAKFDLLVSCSKLTPPLKNLAFNTSRSVQCSNFTKGEREGKKNKKKGVYLSPRLLCAGNLCSKPPKISSK